ncbi:MAG: hypothetical protein ACI8XO_003198 [Verrucomicrobiales bacterium]
MLEFIPDSKPIDAILTSLSEILICVSHLRVHKALVTAQQPAEIDKLNH